MLLITVGGCENDFDEFFDLGCRIFCCPVVLSASTACSSSPARSFYRFSLLITLQLFNTSCENSVPYQSNAPKLNSCHLLSSLGQRIDIL